MNNLNAFLSQNVIKPHLVDYIASNRFIDEEGKPVEWKLKPMNSEDDEKIRQNNTRQEKVKGKNAYTPKFDATGYLAEMAVKSIEFPNLDDKGLQDSYGVMGAKELLKVMLLPGEYQSLLSEIQTINGFNVSMDDLVDEAKN